MTKRHINDIKYYSHTPPTYTRTRVQHKQNQFGQFYASTFHHRLIILRPSRASHHGLCQISYPFTLSLHSYLFAARPAISITAAGDKSRRGPPTRRRLSLPFAATLPANHDCIEFSSWSIRSRRRSRTTGWREGGRNGGQIRLWIPRGDF